MFLMLESLIVPKPLHSAFLLTDFPFVAHITLSF